MVLHLLVSSIVAKKCELSGFPIQSDINRQTLTLLASLIGKRNGLLVSMIIKLKKPLCWPLTDEDKKSEIYLFI